MPKPQILSIENDGVVQIAYSFLPFTMEFRVISKPSTLLSILNTDNTSLIDLVIDKMNFLNLEAESKQIRQISLPGKLLI